MTTETMQPGKQKAERAYHLPFGLRLGLASKRLFDLVVSGLGLVILSPFFLLIAYRIRRESPGPAFYRGLRMGMNGKYFKILKFRTMYERPESYDGPGITAEDDPRITPLGAQLRAAKLNELPQLWNVFKGEMSLVGPRPEDPNVARSWPRNMYREILSVRPGITSPASVVYRREEELLASGSVMDDYLRKILPDKQRLDLLYVRTHSFISDLDVIFLTLVSLMPLVGAKSIPEGTLFSGVLSNFLRRYFSWFVTDTIVAFLAAGLVGVLWRMSGPLDLGWGVSVGIAAVMALVFGVINSLLGLGQVSWRDASPQLVFDLALSSGVATILIFMFNSFLVSRRLLPPGMVIEIGIIALIGFIAVRYRERLLTGLASRWLQVRHQAGALGERVLIVGAGDCGQLAGWLVAKSNLSNAFNVVGMVDDDPLKYRMRYDGHTVLGSTRDLPALVQRYNIGVILYAINKIASPEQERILKLCRGLPVRVVVIPDLIKVLQNSLLPNGVKDTSDSVSI